jgi:hypothetical protein
MIRPSASRTTNSRAPIPSSKLLGYYHSSALRTENSTFRAKPVRLLSLARNSIRPSVLSWQRFGIWVTLPGTFAALRANLPRG